MPTKTQAIKTFLSLVTHSHLADLYSHDMECQVNVAQDGGERIQGEFKGRKWLGWTDELTTWKPFRIPYKAYSEPEFTDHEIKFDLAEHAEAIGMTGWDWKNRVSRWVAFDFDAIIGHSEKHKKKLTNEQLDAVKTAASKIDWVTILKSTSGKGIHLYVFLDAVPTANHNEHAGLARSILGTLSAITGFDFVTKVDNCGGNMWVWHRKMKGTDGLTIVKKGRVFKKIPPNWKDHVKVITGKRRKTLPQNVDNASHISLFEEVVGQTLKIPLDASHKKLIDFLRQTDSLWWWDADQHMLVTHTFRLKQAYEELQLRGFFDTLSQGTNLEEQNCYCFPQRKGGWSVRRFTPGVAEHESWEQDGSGWTRCFLNREPDFKSACRTFGGVEDTKGGFVFREAEVAAKAAQLLGTSIRFDPRLGSRESVLKQHKDGRLIVEIRRDRMDQPQEMDGWLAQKNKPWTRIFNVQSTGPADAEIGNYDDIVRHLVTEADDDAGWMLKSDDIWRTEPINHIRVALTSLGYTGKEINNILGASVFKCWNIVNKPFQPEYTGDREWNRNAAQLRYMPNEDVENLKYSTWMKVLNHCGHSLTDAIEHNPWAKVNGIKTGGEYLKCWISSVFSEPNEPLPYLFFYSQTQNTGKSIFHEALSLLLTKGYRKADAALTNQSGFNGELEGAIICVVEEIDMSKSKTAYNRIKDWVTARELSIHPKGRTPYHVPNTTHWVQCSNDSHACPIFPGDTRVTMVHVDSLSPIEMIPKKHLINLLEKEAADFLAAILEIDLPESNDRLNIPVVTTIDKMMAANSNKTPLQLFIDQNTVYYPGHKIKFSEFFDRFISWLGPHESAEWSKIKVGRELPIKNPRGRRRKDSQFYVGNLCWIQNMPKDEIDIVNVPELVVKDNFLVSRPDYRYES